MERVPSRKATHKPNDSLKTQKKASRYRTVARSYKATGSWEKKKKI